jgi:hypothetical protein
VPAASSVEVISLEGTPVSLDRRGRKETIFPFRGSIRLYGLPAGDCRVRVGSEGRDPVEKSVKIEPGRTAVLVVETP